MAFCFERAPKEREHREPTERVSFMNETLAKIRVMQSGPAHELCAFVCAYETFLAVGKNPTTTPPEGFLQIKTIQHASTGRRGQRAWMHCGCCNRTHWWKTPTIALALGWWCWQQHNVTAAIRYELPRVGGQCTESFSSNAFNRIGLDTVCIRLRTGELFRCGPLKCTWKKYL